MNGFIILFVVVAIYSIGVLVAFALQMVELVKSRDEISLRGVWNAVFEPLGWMWPIVLLLILFGWVAEKTDAVSKSEYWDKPLWKKHSSKAKGE